MKKLILILLLFATPAMAEGVGFSTEGDSTVVTVTLNNARDSAWVRFAFGEGSFYDSVKASPIAGSSNKNLKSTKLDLDSLGGHYVEALTFTSDAVADTVIGQWFHTNTLSKLDSLLFSLGYDPVSGTDLITVQQKLGTIWVLAYPTLFDKLHVLDSIQSKLGVLGVNDRGSLDSTLAVYVTRMLESLGYDGTTSAHAKLDSIIGLGGGSEAETLIVLSTGDSTQIQGARVTVRTIDQSTVKVPGLNTDVNGKLILELDADSFFVAVTHNNYTQALDTIVVASGGQTDTLFMTLFTPSEASGDFCNVYNYLKDAGGNPVKGVTITAQVPVDFWPITYTGEGIKAIRTTKTNGSGYWEMELYPNSLLLTTYGDSSSHYQITAENALYGDDGYKVTVPDLSSFKMAPDSLQ